MNKIIAIFCILFSGLCFSSSKKYFESETHYRTVFGNCPSKSVGRLTLTLMKEFEKENSLLAVKKKIVEDKLEEKYYLSSYKVKYNPLNKILKFEYDCPRPLMKVQIYRKDGAEFYTAILVETGELFDPTYEVLLRGEGKIKGGLPHMALPADLINSNIHKTMTSLINSMNTNFSQNISEVIVNDKEELTIILSVTRKPSSAFLGKDFWNEKVTKLEEIINYMKDKKTIPAVINLTNPKKIVVKFSDN